MKKLMVAGLTALPAFAVMAEGESAGGGEGAQIVSAASQALTGLFTTALPTVLALLGTGLAVWGGFKIVRLVMKAFGFGAR